MARTKLGDLIGTKKCIITGIPAAFSPTCSEKHIPGYIEKIEDLKAKGVEAVFVVSVNDPFVMKAWGKALNAPAEVQMICDPAGEASKAMGVLAPDLIPLFGNLRSERYALLVEGGKVVHALHEEGTGFTKCMVEDMLKLL